MISSLMNTQGSSKMIFDNKVLKIQDEVKIKSLSKTHLAVSGLIIGPVNYTKPLK